MKSSHYSFATLDTPATGAPFGINDLDVIVGTYSDTTGIHGFIYRDGIVTTLNDPLGPNTGATGINNRGQIVGSYNSGNPGEPGSSGFLYSQGVFITIDDPLGTFGTMPNAINDRGEIVGTYIDATGCTRLSLQPRDVHHTR